MASHLDAIILELAHSDTPLDIKRIRSAKFGPHPSYKITPTLISLQVLEE